MPIICVQFCSCLCKVCPRVSEAVLLALQTLSLLTLPQTLAKAFVRSIAFSGSPTSVHCPLHALWYYTVGIPFWTARKRQSPTSKLNEKTTLLHAQVTWSHITIAYVLRRGIRKHCMWSKWLTWLRFITLLTFELCSFRENAFLLHFPLCNRW